MYKKIKIGRHLTYWEFANFAYVELANIQSLPCIVFHFRLETVMGFNLCGLLFSNQ